MDIWLIQNGEKTGPFHDFEVRRKIENLEILPTTPAWHEGLAEWMPLHRISLFASAFERAEEVPVPPRAAQQSPPEPASGPTAVPPLPQSAFPIRRFWARWLDLYLFAGIWWLGMWAAGRDIEATLKDPWIMLFLYIPWFVAESFLLHRFGTTPGKWLLGLRVVNDDGSLLSLAAATRRSARVLFLGIGFGWDIVTLVCQVMAFVVTKKVGRPLWDQAGGHRVIAAPLKPARVVSYLFVLFTALQLRAIVLAPYLMEEASKSSPELKEFFEKHPPWHLPKR